MNIGTVTGMIAVVQEMNIETVTGMIVVVPTTNLGSGREMFVDTVYLEDHPKDSLEMAALKVKESGVLCE